MFSKKTEAINWAGKELSIETGKIARQADGAVVVRFGNTTVLCTCVFAKQQVEKADFFPLTVHYQERLYAVGKIPGGFVKREGKPSAREILISRLVDRPIRPLFPEGFLNEVQIVCTTLSFDPQSSPDVAAIIGASAALSISGVPFLGPIAGCNVGYGPGVGFVLNPRYGDISDNKLELTMAGTKEGVLMVESEASELSEDIMLEAISFGFHAFQPVIEMIERLKESVGNKSSETYCNCDDPTSLRENIRELVQGEIDIVLTTKEKLARRDMIEKAKQRVMDSFSASGEYSPAAIDRLFEKELSGRIRTSLIETGKRLDGRVPTEIRPICCEIDVLPQVHGSALFTRGETQALAVVTLGSSSDEQIVDDVVGDKKEKFLLHYNFPPYSVGEVGRLGAPGRREIGHGKLAKRAIGPVLPDSEAFAYTIRVVSEITESNGSSSMATICCTSLALMASGVPVKSPVAGIAMGLIKEGEDCVVLSDIMGDEDHLGDMDFKVAGTEKGITALQMDIKITSIDEKIIKSALTQAHVGRLHILSKMENVICEHKKELSSNAPRIQILYLDKNKIKDLIGPGGKMIRSICDTTGAKIDIEDSGVVSVFSNNAENMNKALEMIKMVGCSPEIGTVFTGSVVKIADFGAFVSIGGGKEGLVKIGDISNKRIEKVSDVLVVGQEVKVKILSIDERNRIKLSMKNV
jgi:polyribonucleotide nucleotidyltransferase